MLNVKQLEVRSDTEKERPNIGPAQVELEPASSSTRVAPEPESGSKEGLLAETNAVSDAVDPRELKKQQEKERYDENVKFTNDALNLHNLSIRAKHQEKSTCNDGWEVASQVWGMLMLGALLYTALWTPFEVAFVVSRLSGETKKERK